MFVKRSLFMQMYDSSMNHFWLIQISTCAPLQVPFWLAALGRTVCQYLCVPGAPQSISPVFFVSRRQFHTFPRMFSYHLPGRGKELVQALIRTLTMCRQLEGVHQASVCGRYGRWFILCSIGPLNSHHASKTTVSYKKRE